MNFVKDVIVKGVDIMNKNKKCEILFNEIKELSDKYKLVGDMIRILSSSVQNLDFMCKEDLPIFIENCKIVRNAIDKNYTNTLDKLNEIYRDIVEIYEE